MIDPLALPPGLPVPVDDGAARHLAGARVPHVRLPGTGGRDADVAVAAPRFVLFAYPRTGRPGEGTPADWDEIPGARGCTPQACAFRDLHAEFRALGHEVFGLSTNSSAHQAEFAERMRVPYPLLSDERLALTRAMRLPTFEYRGETLLKRLALVVENARVTRVFYPVFPPDGNAADVLAWLARA